MLGSGLEGGREAKAPRRSVYTGWLYDSAGGQQPAQRAAQPARVATYFYSLLTIRLLFVSGGKGGDEVSTVPEGG